MNNVHASRIGYIDVLRATGILAMILGHIGLGYTFNKWIHIFHMPMFFVIAGYFYKEQPFGIMIKKRIRTLIVPYLFFGVFHCLIFFIRNHQFYSHAFYLLFWENTAEAGVPIAGALWFLTAMFVTEIIFWCLLRLKKFRLLFIMLNFVVSVVGMLCATFLPFRLPWAIDVGLVGVGFYMIGRLLKMNGTNVLMTKFSISLAGMIIFSIVGMLCPYVNLRTGRYGIWPLFWINAVGMTISLWNISRYILEWAEKRETLEKTIAWVKGVGRDSVVYLCLNQISILMARDLVNLTIPNGGVVIVVAKKLIVFFITLTELLLFQQIIMRTKLKRVIGR